MKRPVIFSISLFIFSCLNAQKLDLIVTTSNDSIACRIDSISTDIFYFTVKRNNVYIGQIRKDDVVSFKEKAILRSKIRYTENGMYFRTKTSRKSRTRAMKKAEKAELLERGYESMKTLVQSGSFKFFAERMSGKRYSTMVDIYKYPDNYFAVRNNKYSAWLYGLALRNKTGKLLDLEIVENDDKQKIQVNFTLDDPGGTDSRYGNRRLTFRIMPDGRAELIVKDGSGEIKLTYFGNLEPISDW